MTILRRIRLLAFGVVIATAWSGSTMLGARTVLDECPAVFCGHTCAEIECWAEDETQCNQFLGCTFDEPCEQGTETKARCDCQACG